MLLSKRCLPTNGAIPLHFDVPNVSYNIITPSLSLNAADSLPGGDYLERVTPDKGNLICSTMTKMALTLMSL